MLRKGAIELSVNFFVILLISLVIFGFGIKFIYNLSSQATKLRDLTFDDLDKKIGSLVCGSSERVCVGVDRKTIENGNFDIFGIRILNIAADPNFDVDISPASPYIGYRKDDTTVGITSPNLILKYRDALFIKTNEDANLAVGVEVPKNPAVISGTYILNVDIKNGGARYGKTIKLYVDVP